MRITIVLLFALCPFFYSHAQAIKPPPGFKLVKADGVTRQIGHYVKGGYTFMIDDWAGPPPADPFKYDTGVAKFIGRNYRTSLGYDVHFANGIYYGVAHYSDNYIFIALDGGTLYKLSSKKKDAGFEKYAHWLLAQIKVHDRD